MVLNYHILRCGNSEVENMTFILYKSLYVLIRIIDFLILIRVLLSWFPVNRSNPIINIIYTLTEPILEPIRRMLNKSPLGGPGMVLDFSPVIAGVFFELLLSVVASILF